MQFCNDKYSITELSNMLEVTDHTLRYYEKEFNIIVPKDNRGRRYYNQEIANIFVQIKKMRNEGLEIKTNKKILLAKDIIPDNQHRSSSNNIPIEKNTSVCSIAKINNEHQLTTVNTNNSNLEIDTVIPRNNSNQDLDLYFSNLKQQFVTTMVEELCCVKQEITEEITKSKLELGACVENNFRKMENKLDKHFNEVDKSLTNWREKNKPKNIGIKLFKNRY